MKILLVYNAHRHGGGSDMVARRTAELFKGLGHDVRVFSRSSGGLVGLSGRLQAFLCGIWSPSVIRNFKNMLEEFSPDVVHAHEVYPLITPWIFRICRKRGVPVVMTCHDYRISCPIATHFQNGGLCFECVGGYERRCVKYNCCGSWLKSIAYALRNRVARMFKLFGEVDLFLTPSEKAKSILCEYAGLSSDQVVAVGNPVPTVGGEQRSEVSCQLPANNDELITDNGQPRAGYVAYAGRFEPEKGFGVLLEALEGADIPLKVAGDASAYLTPNWTSPDFVEFTGHLTHQEIGEFYQQARMLVVPSLWHETFGLVVAESLSCGTPVVVSDLGALAEVAGPGGVVFLAGDAIALRDTIVRLWNDSDLCRQMGEAGREHVKQYSDEAYVQNILTAYEKVLA